MGSRTLARYSYAKDNGNLTKQTYGNGAEVNFTYDNLDRIKTTTYSGGRSLSYTYNGDGQLAAMTDSATGLRTDYVYDSLGRLIQSKQGDRIFRSYYNQNGQLTGRDFSYPGLSTSAGERYYYRDSDGLLESMTMVDWRRIELTYDSLDRLEKREIAENGLVTQNYTYVSSGGTTSTRVETYESKYTGATSTATFANAVKYKYEYDAAGNITKQTDLLTTGDNWAYTYGKQGELITARGHSGDGSNANYVYEYDAAGNLTSKTVTVANGITPPVTYTDTYTYSNGDWRDLLTAFNGNTITYDAIGNPTKYYDGSTMVWKEGRRLSSVTKDGKTTSYLYDSNGQRIQKTNADGSYTKYCVLDGRVIGEIIYKKTANGVKWSHGMRYIYGDDGSMVGFGIWDADTVNEWERYYFVKNLQGDVRKVYREADNKLVASFDYDPFGKVISATGDMADQIPFRYRGYYYDTETGFYYLNSRYYDPLTCRFINADSYTSTGQSFIGYNMFAYCNNNSVMIIDCSGNKPQAAIDTDGDGIEDCFVYTYTYTKGILWWKREHTGYVYIYTGKSKSFFDDPANTPDGFNKKTDLMVGDYTNQGNPNMYAYAANLTKKEYREAILECMLAYDDDFNTPWDRTLPSLLVEWHEHKKYAFFSDRARNVDFDNDEEGKGAWYYAQKAWNAFWEG